MSVENTAGVGIKDQVLELLADHRLEPGRTCDADTGRLLCLMEQGGMSLVRFPIQTTTHGSGTVPALFHEGIMMDPEMPDKYVFKQGFAFPTLLDGLVAPKGWEFTQIHFSACERGRKKLVRRAQENLIGVDEAEIEASLRYVNRYIPMAITALVTILGSQEGGFIRDVWGFGLSGVMSFLVSQRLVPQVDSRFSGSATSRAEMYRRNRLFVQFDRLGSCFGTDQLTVMQRTVEVSPGMDIGQSLAATAERMQLRASTALYFKPQGKPGLVASPSLPTDSADTELLHEIIDNLFKLTRQQM